MPKNTPHKQDKKLNDSKDSKTESKTGGSSTVVSSSSPKIKREPKDLPTVSSDQSPQANKATKRKVRQSPKKATKKIKSEETEHKIFSGLVFFLIPFARTKLFSIKETAYEEAGARIADSKEDEGITHYIVIKNWTYKDVLKSLKSSSIPDRITLVKDEWAADCIEQDTLVNANRATYQIQGAEDVSVSKIKKDPVTPIKQPSTVTPRSGTSYPEDAKGTISAETTTQDNLPSTQSGDELEKYIKQADLHSLIEGYLSSDDEATNNQKVKSSEHRIRRPELQKDQTSKRWQTNSLLLSKPSEQSLEHNPNWRVIEIFKLMMDYYEHSGDEWRALAYRRALAILRRQKKEIKTAEEAKKLPGFGSKLSDKLEEIVTTHRLRRLDEANQDESTKVRAILENIYGVGTKTSLNWYKQGVRTLEDARNRKDLSPSQRIGIEHYDDFLKKIPRKETQLHFETVQKALQEINPDLECTCMGSYRRGRPETGDIDIIITNPTQKKSNNIGSSKRSSSTTRSSITNTAAAQPDIAELRRAMLKLVVKLFKQGFLRCALAGPDPREYDGDVDRMEKDYMLSSSSHFNFGSSSDGGSDGLSKWYGASMLKDVGIWRRIDFLIVPYEELGAAMLYFTGSNLFNRTMRYLAQLKGYSLNQHGLYKNVIRVKRKKTTDGQLVESQSERRIFEILGIPYREPSERSLI